MTDEALTELLDAIRALPADVAARERRLRDVPGSGYRNRPSHGLTVLEVAAGECAVVDAARVLKQRHDGMSALLDGFEAVPETSIAEALEGIDALGDIAPALVNAVLRRGLRAGGALAAAALCALEPVDLDHPAADAIAGRISALMSELPSEVVSARRAWLIDQATALLHRHRRSPTVHPDAVRRLWDLLPWLHRSELRDLTDGLELAVDSHDAARTVVAVRDGYGACLDELDVLAPHRRMTRIRSLLWPWTARPGLTEDDFPPEAGELIDRWASDFTAPDADRRWVDPFGIFLPQALGNRLVGWAQRLPDGDAEAAILRQVRASELEVPSGLAERVARLPCCDRLGAWIAWLHVEPAPVPLNELVDAASDRYGLCRDPSWPRASPRWPALGNSDAPLAHLGLARHGIDPADALARLRARPFGDAALALDAARACAAHDDASPEDRERLMAWLNAAPIDFDKVRMELVQAREEVPAVADRVTARLVAHLEAAIDMCEFALEPWVGESLCAHVAELPHALAQPLWEALDASIRGYLADPRHADRLHLEMLGYAAPGVIGRAALADAAAQGRLGRHPSDLHQAPAENHDVAVLDRLWAYHANLGENFDPADRVAHIALAYPPELRHERIDAAIELAASDFFVEPHGEAPFTALAPHLDRSQILRALEIVEHHAADPPEWDLWQVDFARAALARRLLALNDVEAAAAVCGLIGEPERAPRRDLELDLAVRRGDASAAFAAALEAIPRSLEAELIGVDGLHRVFERVMEGPAFDGLEAALDRALSPANIATWIDWERVGIGFVDFVGEGRAVDLVEAAWPDNVSDTEPLEEALQVAVDLAWTLCEAGRRVPERLRRRILEGTRDLAAHDLEDALTVYQNVPKVLGELPLHQRVELLERVLQRSRIDHHAVVLASSLGLDAARTLRDVLGRLAGMD